LADFFKIFSSETALPNESKLGRKHLWQVLYKHCLWQGELKKIWKIQNVLTKSSEGPAKTCIKVVPVGPESTGSQADGREWEQGQPLYKSLLDPLMTW
jgi:hypothetical protein